MPRHFEDRTRMGEVLVGSYPDPTTVTPAPPGGIIGSTSGYHVQRRGGRGGETFRGIQDRSLLREGFGAFLAQTDKTPKLGDAAKRHFAPLDSGEQRWRPCMRTVEPFDHTPKPHGKRFNYENAAEGVEFDDLPRGRRFIEPPPSAVAEDVFAQQHRGRVRDASTGELASARLCPPSDTTNFSTESQRRHLRAGDRNGLPQIAGAPGDKLYTAVEFSPAFTFFEKHRLGLEPPPSGPSKPTPAQAMAAREAAAERAKDMLTVAALPKYPKADAAAAAAAPAAAATAGRSLPALVGKPPTPLGNSRRQ